jgi:hypothetical protein
MREFRSPLRRAPSAKAKQRFPSNTLHGKRIGLEEVDQGL